MLRRGVRGVVTAFSLLCVAASAQAQPKSFPWLDARQYPGAPAIIADLLSFTQDVPGPEPRQVLCLSFRVRASSALTSVTFTLSSRDAQGKELQHATIAPAGTFEPGVKVAGSPQTAPSTCVASTMMRSEAAVVTVRLIAATYADGRTWTAPDTPLPPTPPPATPPP
jgi:hypothetical protein